MTDDGSSGASRGPQIDRAVEAFISLHEAGEAPDLALFCAGQPETLRPEIRRKCQSYLDLVPVLGRNGGAADPLTIPQPARIAGYEIERKIGVGGMGTVYEATRKATGEVVALKLLHRHLAESLIVVERFRHEAIAATRLAHPDIVSLQEIGEADGWHFIAMDLVHGRTLFAELEAARQDDGPEADAAAIERAYRVGITIARALAYAHDNKIIHRDIKPQNILLDEQGEAHLADFGLARLLDQNSLTLSGQLCGTTFYMSPEQALAKRVQVDHRTDVYSLGVVLYEILTRRRPFGGETREQILYEVSFSRPTPIRQFNPAVPADLEEICLTAMEKRPGDRFPDAAAMAENLERCRDQRPLIHRRPSGWLRAGRWARERWRPLAAAVVVVAAVALLQRSTARSHLPTLEIEITNGTSDTVVQVTSANDEGAVETYQSTGRRFDERVAAGVYRVRGRDPAGGVFELTVAVQPGANVRVAATCHPRRPRDPAMVRVAGGTVTLVTPPRQRTVTVRPFRIDRHETSNGEYREFLAAGGTRPPFWPAEDSPRWRDRPADFDRLPATDLTFDEVQQYASWKGKRLPTRAEWEMAARGTEGRRFPWGDDAGPLEERVRYPTVADASLDAWDRYLLYVRPVDEAPTGSENPLGLLHTMGNVWEMTSSEYLDDDQPIRGAYYFCLGTSFSARLNGLEPESGGVATITAVPAFDRGYATGFRLARNEDD